MLGLPPRMGVPLPFGCLGKVVWEVKRICFNNLLNGMEVILEITCNCWGCLRAWVFHYVLRALLIPPNSCRDMFCEIRGDCLGYLPEWNGRDLREHVYLLRLPPLMAVPLRFKGATDSSESLRHMICEIKCDCCGCLRAWAFHCVSGLSARRFGR